MRTHNIPSCKENQTRAPHVDANARLQLHLKNSKSKKGHNLKDYLPYWYGFPFDSEQLL